MQIDFTQPLTDIDDKPLRDELAGMNGAKVDLTLGRAAAHALSASFQDEQGLSGEQKFARGMLAFAVRDNPAADLKAEDVVLIKQMIARLYGPIIVFRAFPMLDPQERPR